MRNIFEEGNLAGKNAISEDGRWLMGVSAIVADNQDPERQHRVRVVIPSIDENEIFDEWARQLVFCLGNKRGAAFIPPKNSEVILFGQLGQKYNLFYASVYNEEMFVPDEFNDEKSVGIHAPGDLILKADENTTLNGDEVEINGGKVTVSSDGTISISGGTVKISGNLVTIHNRVVNKVGPAI